MATSRPSSSTALAPLSPTTHAPFVEDMLRTAFRDLFLDSTLLSESRADDHRSPFGGEHEFDDSGPHLSPLRQPRSDPATDSSDSVGRRDSMYGYRYPQTAFQRPVHPTDPPPQPVRNPYSVSGLQPLQTFIPNDLFPDDLLVYDPDNITAPSALSRMRRFHNSPVRYVRVFPNLKAPREPYHRHPAADGCQNQNLKGAPEHFMPPKPAFASRSPSDPVRTAHLYLRAGNTIGTGHHSSVYAAPLRLRLDPASREESIVRVAAKTARGSCGPHTMLHIEAGVYDAFPRHLMEDQWTSHGAAQPDASAQAAANSSNTTSTHPPGSGATEFAPAVVPKFFGYYAAVGADGATITSLHTGCGEAGACRVSWPTRLLLVEECGKPVCPQVFTQQQKLQCLQLVRRMHAAGFAQNSMFVRNVLMQPGPLRAPPAMRSYTTPSFRIIDFGRGVVLWHLPSPGDGGGGGRAFRLLCAGEEWRAAHRVLELPGVENDPMASESASAERTTLEILMCTGYTALIMLLSSLPPLQN